MRILIDRPLLDAGTLRGDGERNRPEALEQMLEGLGDEHSLILFPEGTRGSGESIAQFAGLFYLCRERPDVELVPVHPRRPQSAPEGPDHPTSQDSDLTFGPPMHLEDGETKTAFIERARTALRMLGRRSRREGTPSSSNRSRSWFSTQ